jgi:acyl-CoA synthetase (AMP-forming)/AMP-acid ligase II
VFTDGFLFLEGISMLLHHHFIRIAKQFENKTAIIDRTTGKSVSYGKALIASLILADKFKKYEEGFIGIMIPTSAGCALSILGALMSGRVPVMINYSTGAAQNCEYAQKKCAFKTIIASKALVEKINCPRVQGMIFIEDIMEQVSILDKVKAALRAKLPIERLLKKFHAGEDDDNAIILFTSGSEKDPKAVQLTHRNISANVDGLIKVFEFTSDDIFLANLPFFHVFGQTANLWLPLYYGMKLLRMPTRSILKLFAISYGKKKLRLLSVRQSSCGDICVNRSRAILRRVVLCWLELIKLPIHCVRNSFTNIILIFSKGTAVRKQARRSVLIHHSQIDPGVSDCLYRM